MSRQQPARLWGKRNEWWARAQLTGLSNSLGLQSANATITDNFVNPLRNAMQGALFFAQLANLTDNAQYGLGPVTYEQIQTLMANIQFVLLDGVQDPQSTLDAAVSTFKKATTGAFPLYYLAI